MIAEIVIADLHSINGHHGIQKTMMQIKERFIIDRLQELTTHVINNCTICQQFKILAQKIGKSETQKIRAHEPLQIVCADLAGPFLNSEKKKIWTLILIDKFTKFTVLTMLEDLTDEALSHAVLTQWIHYSFQSFFFFFFKNKLVYFVILYIQKFVLVK